MEPKASSHPFRRASGSGVLEGETAPVVRAAEMRFGLRLQEGLRSLLMKAAIDLTHARVAESIAEVAARVLTGPEDDPVVRKMREVASIGETYFFRIPEQLKMLEELAEEEILKPKRRRNVRSLRLWSAACSTGEEAYTLAMIFKRIAPEFDLQIIATDMNAASLEVARRGIYRGRSWRQIGPEAIAGGGVVQSKTGDGWEVTPEIKRLVTFHTLNLVTDVYPNTERGVNGFDVVLCRNVLIYLDEAKIPGVMRQIAASSAPRTLLALTPAEYMASRYLVGYETRPHGLLVRTALRKAPAETSGKTSKTRKAASSEAAARGKVIAEEPSRVVAPSPPAAEPPALTGVLESVGAFEMALEAARAAADRGDFDEAHRLARVALSHRQDSPEPHFLLAAMWSAAREPAHALREYQQVLFLDRDSIAAELGLGHALSMEGKEEVARPHFERALRLLDTRKPTELIPQLGVTAQVARRLAVDGLEGRR